MELVTTTKNFLENLSYLESIAIQAIVNALEGETDKVIVTSSIANDNKITKTTCVSALRLLSCAGIVHTKSLGMKGQRIKVINPEALQIIVSGL